MQKWVFTALHLSAASPVSRKDADAAFKWYHHEVSFDRSAAAVQELGHPFGSFQNTECRGLKGVLMDMEVAGTGRVPLSEFYRVGLKEDWQFNEDEDYLRSLGALDETDPKRPSVLVTNYIHSQTNCLSTSGFYSVCCIQPSSSERIALNHTVLKDISLQLVQRESGVRLGLWHLNVLGLSQSWAPGCRLCRPPGTLRSCGSGISCQK